MFGRSPHINNLNRVLQSGGNFNAAQQTRINSMRQPGADLSTQELQFLDDLSGREQVAAEKRRRHRDNIRKNQLKTKAANQQELSSDETKVLNTLLEAERTANRNEDLRRIATAAAGMTALGAGGVGAAALAYNLAPFSTSLDSEGADLAAQQFRIEEELLKRQHQDTIAQRTAVQEADLQQDLRAIEQKMRLESQLTNQLKQEAAQGPNAFDIEKNVKELAAGFMQQGLDPNQAYSKAIEVTSMQARNQGYL